ncbi:MAG TPA: lactate utilization protein [Acidimicrobiia bacterium]|nr:lactate utilization protein [Acidimicrobiia bacterium]
MKLDELLTVLPADDPGASPGLVVPDLEHGDLVSLFMQRLRAVDGTGHGPLPLRAAANSVLSIFSDAGVDSYLGWDDPGLPGIHGRLALVGIKRVDAWVPKEPARRLTHQSAYTDVGGGLTGADFGLAESGSIVLRSGPGRARLASIVPAVHVAILPVGRVIRSLAHYAAEHPAAPTGLSNLVVVTGPSRTGDIEQQLNLGVHGPRHLHVVLVN